MIELPATVELVEVGPRDGLQSFPRFVDTSLKVEMIERLAEAGFRTIEAVNFASPRAIPNLADAEAVMARLRRRPGTRYRGLVPNARGAERAVGTGVDEIAGLVVVSETYLAKNQNMTLDRAIAEAIRAAEIADRAGLGFTMALAMTMWCPYEGAIAPDRVLAVLAPLHAAGMRRFYLAGSVGMETPRQVSTLFRLARTRFPDASFGYHVHNLSGMAPASVLAALDGGAVLLEGAICGLGGGIAMPAEVGPVGNYPSEDLAHLLAGLGVETGVAPEAAIAAARDVARLLDITPRSHAAHVGTAADVLCRMREGGAVPMG